MVTLTIRRKSINHLVTSENWGSPLPNLEIVNMKSFDTSIGSHSMSREDINWRALNCETGYRLKLDNDTECSVWSSDFVHPCGVPHTLKNTLALHKFSEYGNISNSTYHIFLSLVISEIFKDNSIKRIYTWVNENSVKNLNQNLLNIGWYLDDWYLYS